MKFQFMKDHKKKFSIEKMAKIFQVSRAGYYKFLQRKPSKRDVESNRLIKKIRKIYKTGRGTYGSPRIHKALKKEGEACSRKKVARLMRKERIQPKMRKRWKTTTKRNPKAESAPNHLDQNFDVDGPNIAWVSDITYIETLEGWLYVAVILDLYSRKVVGLGMGGTLETKLIIQALEQAVCHRKIKGGLIHHSDRGSQYTSEEFQKFVEKHNIKLSMSGQGNCYDNAVAESFFHTLKTEHSNQYKFKTRNEAKLSIFEYIEVFYNRKRLHSYLGYRSPEEYESLEKTAQRKTA